MGFIWSTRTLSVPSCPKTPDDTLTVRPLVLALIDRTPEKTHEPFFDSFPHWVRRFGNAMGCRERQRSSTKTAETRRAPISPDPIMRVKGRANPLFAFFSQMAFCFSYAIKMECSWNCKGEKMSILWSGIEDPLHLMAGSHICVWLWPTAIGPLATAYSGVITATRGGSNEFAIL